MNATKTCTRCGQTKPLDEFYRNSECKGGYANQCKACVLRRDREKYRERHQPLSEADPRTCDHCGKLFQPVAHNQLYCCARCRMRAGDAKGMGEYNLKVSFAMTTDPWRGVNDINMNPFPGPHQTNSEAA